MKKLALLIGLVGFSVANVAAENFDPCQQAMTQTEISSCSINAFRKADDLLNQEFKKSLGLLGSVQKEKLRLAQRAWLNFRDMQCEFHVYDTKGGNMYDAVKNDCLRDLTEQRTKQLQAINSNAEILAKTNNNTGIKATAETNTPPQLVTEGKKNIPVVSTVIIEPSITGVKPTAKQLLGTWTSTAKDVQLKIHFVTIDDKNLFSSTLNNAPFEAGIWQLEGDELLITSSTGQLLRKYVKATISEDSLILQEQNSGKESYKKVN